MNNILPWRLSWLTVILAVLTLGTFLAISGPNGVRYAYPMMGGGTVAYEKNTVSAPSAPTAVSGSSDMNIARIPDYYPYPGNPDVPITDTREFLKIYYGATMRSRDVSGLTRRVETTVRGYSGRVDQESVSDKYGSVSFSVPQNKFDAFRTEVESFVGSRFIQISVSSQNMLSQKVSIEEQQKQADKSVADYGTYRQKLVTTHATTVQSIKAGIDSQTKQLAALRAATSTPDIVGQIQAALDNIAMLNTQLVNENASYAKALNATDESIKMAQDWQKAVKSQDQALMNSIATVTGTISVQWISLWNIALLYLPGYWIPGIFAVLTILSYTRDRRRTLA